MMQTEVSQQRLDLIALAWLWSQSGKPATEAKLATALKPMVPEASAKLLALQAVERLVMAGRVERNSGTTRSAKTLKISSAGEKSIREQVGQSDQTSGVPTFLSISSYTVPALAAGLKVPSSEAKARTEFGKMLPLAICVKHFNLEIPLDAGLPAAKLGLVKLALSRMLNVSPERIYLKKKLADSELPALVVGPLVGQAGMLSPTIDRLLATAAAKALERFGAKQLKSAVVRSWLFADDGLAVAPSPSNPGEGRGVGDLEHQRLSTSKSPSPQPSPGVPGEGVEASGIAPTYSRAQGSGRGVGDLEHQRPTTSKSPSPQPSPGVPGEGVEASGIAPTYSRAHGSGRGEGDLEHQRLSTSKSPSPQPSPGVPGEGEEASGIAPKYSRGRGSGTGVGDLEHQRPRTSKSPSPQPSPGVPGEGAGAGAPVDLLAFSLNALHAARAVASEQGPGVSALGDKVLVHYAWRRYEQSYGPLPLERFKQNLSQVNGDHLVLVREDLVPVERADEFNESEVRTGASRYHYIRVSNLRG